MSYVRTVTARTVSCPESHVFSPVGTVATIGYYGRYCIGFYGEEVSIKKLIYLV